MEELRGSSSLSIRAYLLPPPLTIKANHYYPYSTDAVRASPDPTKILFFSLRPLR